MSTWQLSFSNRIDYSRFNDIVFPLTLLSEATTQILVRVKLDTGSTFCVFQRCYADLLNLEMEKGTRQNIKTATGSFAAYGHEVTLVVGELEWLAVVYSAKDENFPINVAGRVGFLDRLCVGLVDYEHLFYLGAYDEA